MLSLKSVSKAFTGVQALQDVDFSLRAGEVHALLGENGAGKSTLIKVISGVYASDSGSITLDGESCHFSSNSEAGAAGISTVFQEINLLPNLSVAHNLFLGQEPLRFGCISHRRMRQDAERLLQPFKLDIDVSKPLGGFSVAVQQLVAIARGVSRSAKVLILDEPTASLDAQETETLFRLMEDLREQGMAILFVTHFLDQVYRISDRISILRNGRMTGTWQAAELERRELVAQMLGKELAETEAPDRSRHQQYGSIWMEARQLSVQNSLAPVDLTIHHGEALGLAGLLGSGRSELCRALFALDKLSSGSIRLAEHQVHCKGPADAIRHGMALCPEDRKAQGIIGPLSVTDNLMLALQAKRGWLKRLGRREQLQLADDMIRRLGIKVADRNQPVEQLSGGNQQKVLLGRALLSSPQLMILDEPTRGIDVGAHAEIIKLIRQLCEQGMSLLVTSSELEELVQFADRVAVMRDRHKVAELAGEQISESAIMSAIAAPHVAGESAHAPA